MTPGADTDAAGKGEDDAAAAAFFLLFFSLSDLLFADGLDAVKALFKALVVLVNFVLTSPSITGSGTDI